MNTPSAAEVHYTVMDFDQLDGWAEDDHAAAFEVFTSTCGDMKDVDWRALCKLAKLSGTKLVAEGIERVDDLLVCRELGIDYAQGYLLARPAEVPALTLSEEALRALRVAP